MNSDITDDRFLGGRVIVRQMQSGFRSGLDAVMLAASISAREGEEVLELGAGAGAASLCLARRSGCSVTGLEIDPALTALADENAAQNDLSARVRFVTGDIHDMPGELRRSFEHVMCNPPFHAGEGEASPDPARAKALHDGGTLAAWLTGSMKRVVSDGTLTLILRADRLGEALAALGERGVAVFPLWPKTGEAAKRVLVRAVKASRAPFALLPGMVLHESDGRPTRAVNAILRDGATLLPLSAR